jgi:hypothetical protein
VSAFSLPAASRHVIFRRVSPTRQPLDLENCRCLWILRCVQGAGKMQVSATQTPAGAPGAAVCDYVSGSSSFITPPTHPPTHTPTSTSTPLTLLLSPSTEKPIWLDFYFLLRLGLTVQGLPTLDHTTYSFPDEKRSHLSIF